MPSPLADIFRRAAELNRRDDRREGNVVRLEGGCEVIASGDLHGHGENLTRLIAFADLGSAEQRRLVLQEIIHGPPDPRTGRDRSVEQLLRVARLKVAHPRQVLLLLGNHDVAQAMGSEITKAGRGVCEDFVRGVEHACGDGRAAEALEAINDFLLSAPLAIRTPGKVMMLHSLPSPGRMRWAGEQISADPYEPADLRRGGWVYEWTWGRKQTLEQIDLLARRLDVGLFVLGHRRITSRFEIISPKAIILTAEHDRGCVMHFPSAAAINARTAPDYLKPLAALGAGP